MTLQRWLPALAALSGAIAILAFSGALPLPLTFVIKPLTTLLTIAFAWPRGHAVPRQRRFIGVRLILSLAGDVALLWPQQGFLPGLVAFLLAHLAYIAAFCTSARLAAKPTVFVLYAAIALAILLQLWPGVPAGLRAPVAAYVVCLAAMAAQAGVAWQVALDRGSEFVPLARRAALGGLLFMVSDSLLAINRFATPLPLASVWILLSYWLAQACVAASLPARTAASTSP